MRARCESSRAIPLIISPVRGSRERSADRPAALVAILPLHDVVARVHRIDTFRKIFDSERTLQPGAVECLESTSSRPASSRCESAPEFRDRCNTRSDS